MKQLATTSQELLRAEFDHIEELCASVGYWDLDFRPLKSAFRTGTCARIIQLRRGPLLFTYGRITESLEQAGAPPPGLLTFVIPGVSLRRLWWRGRDVDASTVLAFPLGSELRSFSGPDFEVYTIAMTEEVAAEICERFHQSLPSAKRRPEVFRLPAAELNTLRHILRLGLHKRSEAALRQTSTLLEQVVLVWAQASKDVRLERIQSGRARDQAIRRCLELIACSPWHELSAAKLCELSGVGERTLQLAFRERFSLTPAAFLKARRLALVRDELRRGNPGKDAVGHTAAALGFTHVGQFAADYRRAFGESPSETLHQGAVRST